MSESTLLVTGASGQLGRRVIDLLLESGVSAGRIIATTRTPDKLADLAAQGVVVRHADFDHAASLRSAFEGADRLLLISTDVVGVPGQRLQQHLNAVQAATEAGVKHVVYTSLVNADNTPVTLAPDHAGTEKALEASGLGWTVLRENIYAEMTIGTVKQALQLGGKIYGAAGDGRTAFIAREDIAHAAVAALTADFEGRRILNLTGSEALTQGDLAAIATQITGTPIDYVPLPSAVVAGNLNQAGLPEPIVAMILSFDEGTAQGKFAAVSGDFKTLTGRDPIRVADFVAAQREAFVDSPTF